VRIMHSGGMAEGLHSEGLDSEWSDASVTRDMSVAWIASAYREVSFVKTSVVH